MKLYFPDENDIATQSVLGSRRSTSGRAHFQVPEHLRAALCRRALRGILVEVLDLDQLNTYASLQALLELLFQLDVAAVKTHLSLDLGEFFNVCGDHNTSDVTLVRGHLTGDVRHGRVYLLELSVIARSFGSGGQCGDRNLVALDLEHLVVVEQQAQVLSLEFVKLPLQVKHDDLFVNLWDSTDAIQTAISSLPGLHFDIILDTLNLLSDMFLVLKKLVLLSFKVLLD